MHRVGGPSAAAFDAASSLQVSVPARSVSSFASFRQCTILIMPLSRRPGRLPPIVRLLARVLVFITRSFATVRSVPGLSASSCISSNPANVQHQRVAQGHKTPAAMSSRSITTTAN